MKALAYLFRFQGSKNQFASPYQLGQSELRGSYKGIDLLAIAIRSMFQPKNQYKKRECFILRNFIITAHPRFTRATRVQA